MCVEPNTRSSVQIPLDIIELIVAEVAFNAPLHQLKNLSLASHTLKTLCRPYMFRRVVLFFGEWQDPIEGDLPSTKHCIPSMKFIAFTTFLNSNGYAKHIRLRISYHSSLSARASTSWILTTMSRAPWLKSSQSGKIILQNSLAWNSIRLFFLASIRL